MSRHQPAFPVLHHTPEDAPFCPDDVTAGVENELQAAVIGSRGHVDLPLTIEGSNYFANIARRAATGEITRRDADALGEFLASNSEMVWEHSWARFPRRVLCPLAQNVLDEDLLADKSQPGNGSRSDRGRFLFEKNGEEWARVPISYLLKLALADVVGSQALLPERLKKRGLGLLNHYLNDNISPETSSFYVVSSEKEGLGTSVTREVALRYLLTQLLTRYANIKFGLEEDGQKAVVHFAPAPPVRLRDLNELIADAFYAELFVSPCLSGWDRGEEKHRYMLLCHQVLSRSQLNAISKLREAGIITNNLVTLPNTSHLGLANNGTHVSIGSRLLTNALADRASGISPLEEKRFGDLAIKIAEHFLPLFVGTYSAAPYRLSFADFHPEKVLGFLPHELDYTHLRMIWRRWKKKAAIKVFGRPLTPFGPRWIDGPLSAALGLKGDFVPDFRLIDYFVSLMGTERSPALDGRPGNHARLRQDLASMGVFDSRMATYLLFRLREYATMGFSGFEARHYSLFEGLSQDMAPAVQLQALVTALSYRYATSRFSHAHIPDDISTESERRQIFFGSAIGIPTFFVKKDTKNLFLREIIARTERGRPSRRYPGFLRVPNLEYRKALARLIREEAPDLVEMYNAGELLSNLDERLENQGEGSALSRLIRGILGGRDQSPLSVEARKFNIMAERYYREDLRKKHMDEGFSMLEETMRKLEDPRCLRDPGLRSSILFACGEEGGIGFIRGVKKTVLADEAPLGVITRLINQIITAIDVLARESVPACATSPPASACLSFGETA